MAGLGYRGLQYYTSWTSVSISKAFITNVRNDASELNQHLFCSLGSFILKGDSLLQNMPRYVCLRYIKSLRVKNYFIFHMNVQQMKDFENPSKAFKKRFTHSSWIQNVLRCN